MLGTKDDGGELVELKSRRKEVMQLDNDIVRSIDESISSLPSMRPRYSSDP